MDTGYNYFVHGKVVAESGDVKVYKMNDELFLEIGPGHNLWALEAELEDYVFQLGNKPNGDCLEIGLGLGVASRYILSCPGVRTLTTVEINSDIINVQEGIRKYYDGEYDEDRHLILNSNGLYYAYKTKKLFDFIFLDFYSHIDEETLPQIEDMAEACGRLLKEGGSIIGWFDKYTPNEFVKSFYRIFKKVNR